MTYAAIVAATLALQWVAILGMRRVRHRHEWTEWSKWMVDSGPWSDSAWWASRRRCRICNKGQRRRTGKHRCRTPKACGHANQFDTLLESDAQRIARLERELSISGPIVTDVLRQRLDRAERGKR